jgi:dihydropteroate synthase
MNAAETKVSARKVYIRPLARLAASAAGDGLPALAVGGPYGLCFAAAEVIERDGSDVRRRVLGAADLLNEANADEQALLQRVRQPRADLAGIRLDRPRLIGVVNVTPDSFADGGRYSTKEAAIAHALRLESEGADILDIGGESTRPGSEGVDVEEECRRVLPVISALASKSRARLSIDTRKAEVMRRATLEGAHIINDVSALRHDPQSLDTVARLGQPAILMHAQGDPRTMQDNPSYGDVVLDVYDMLEARIAACERAGIPRSRLIVDPGIGFGKNLMHNLALLGALSIFHGLGCGVLLGASRKSFIGHLTGADAPGRLPGSIAAALLGAAQGVQLLRVHDVAATRQALAVWEGAQGGTKPAALCP